MSDPASESPSGGGRPWTATLVAALMAALGLGGGLLLRQPAEPAPIVIQPPPATVTPTPLPTATAAPVVVFVSGAVNSPGVYTLPQGARVADALRAAGGLTADAHPYAVNQAARLHDGDQVHIPTQGEAPSTPAAGITGAGSTDNDSPGAGELLDLNTASQAALEGLPGIGPAKARDIIAHRPYTSVDDLLRVPGFGPATLERLRPHVRVE